jgi:hypothetical protein
MPPQNGRFRFLPFFVLGVIYILLVNERSPTRSSGMGSVCREAFRRTASGVVDKYTAAWLRFRYLGTIPEDGAGMGAATRWC